MPRSRKPRPASSFASVLVIRAKANRDYLPGELRFSGLVDGHADICFVTLHVGDRALHAHGKHSVIDQWTTR